MANCNPIFKEFNREIRLDDDRRVLLREKRNELRKRIEGGYGVVQEHQYVVEEIEFQSQGSYVMDTIINPSRKEDEYDLDDGIYFLGTHDRHDRPTPADFHEFIIAAIEKGQSPNTIEEIVDKDTCVRVKYKGQNGDFNYHVDLPIYYAIDVREPDLADKKEGWHISSPVEFIVWFEEKIQSGFKSEFILESRLYSDEYDKWLNDVRKKDHQLRRIVRYLKAWGDHCRGEMPPGVVMTILAASDNNYSVNERDDVALRDTLVNIKDWLISNGFRCPRPTTPAGEDLFKSYSPERKASFKQELDRFIESANQALATPNQKDACPKWRKHLGDRFPCHLAKDYVEGAKTYDAPAVIGSNNSRSA
ncbi:cyclic GMP-AMP synthase DncV-like nucleotidyltransferase [Phaeocystidibacter marisrubri]|uniref:Cyclic GMP-AMP synthase n=1 Tax=Phaeocystidibacter marisrubri TaxID=1577780 RepID=A0A6L3ZCK7_9FLAO|nr:hypothetical protein [Phaeocystidibacter marisrubri]KAB2815601.1 hypothetical protein F8C82_07815 [Phaeocystidibacter marisrubri]GGH64733.1 hypothetical protein GCM10011318_01050 [Phaeocystidibacter marisrubri]